MKRILLYGDSIFLGGLAAQLEAQTNLDVRRQMADAGPVHLDDIDAVIVDLNDVPASDVLEILRARPHLQVVVVNASGSLVTVLSGKVYLAHTIADVVHCL